MTQYLFCFSKKILFSFIRDIIVFFYFDSYENYLYINLDYYLKKF